MVTITLVLGTSQVPRLETNKQGHVLFRVNRVIIMPSHDLTVLIWACKKSDTLLRYINHFSDSLHWQVNLLIFKDLGKYIVT